MTESVSARLEWRGVRLHPLREHDMGWLRQVELSDYLAFRWRHRGEHIPPAEFGSSLWAATFVNFVVARPSAQTEGVGIVSAYELDNVSMHCKVAVAAFAPRHHRSTFLGLMLTLDYLFAGWPLRKIYFDVPAFNLGQINGAVRRHLVVEGVLREHIYLNDHMHDLNILALYRQDWQRLTATLPGWPT